MTDQPEIKPCPFCKSVPTKEFLRSDYSRIYIQQPDQKMKKPVFFICLCGCHGPDAWVDLNLDEQADFSAAITAWNSRVEPIGNSEELPEWMRKAIETEIEIQLSECGLKAEALYWVLSLKKPEPE